MVRTSGVGLYLTVCKLSAVSIGATVQVNIQLNTFPTYYILKSLLR